MTIGEAIALMCQFSSDTGSDGDDLLMHKSAYSIDINEDCIELYFIDANTPNYRIYKDGKREYLD